MSQSSINSILHLSRSWLLAKKLIIFIAMIGISRLPLGEGANFFSSILIFYLVPGLFFYSYLIKKSHDIVQLLSYSLGFGITFHVLFNLPVFLFALNTKIIFMALIPVLAGMFVFTNLSVISLKPIRRTEVFTLLLVLIVSILFYRVGAIQTGEDPLYYTMVNKLYNLSAIHPWDMSNYSDQNHIVKLSVGIAPFFSAIATFCHFSELDTYFVLKKYVWLFFIFGSLTFYSLVYEITGNKSAGHIGVLVYILTLCLRIINVHSFGFTFVTESIRPQLFNSYYFMPFVLLCFLYFWREKKLSFNGVITLNLLLFALVLQNISHIVPMFLILFSLICIAAFEVIGWLHRLKRAVFSASIFVIPALYVLYMMGSISNWSHGLGVHFLTAVQDMHYFDTRGLIDGQTLGDILSDEDKYNLENFSFLNFLERKKILDIFGCYYMNPKTLANTSYSLLIAVFLTFGRKLTDWNERVSLISYVALFSILVMWFIPPLTELIFPIYVHKFARISEFWYYFSSVLLTVIITNLLKNLNLKHFCIFTISFYLFVNDIIKLKLESSTILFFFQFLLVLSVILFTMQSLISKKISAK